MSNRFIPIRPDMIRLSAEPRPVRMEVPTGAQTSIPGSLTAPVFRLDLSAAALRLSGDTKR